MKTISKAQQKRDEQAHALQKLQELCPPGTTVYTSCEQVSRSGMSRHIKCYIVDPADNEIRDISYLAARALGNKISDKTGGLVIGGCGMDMGFHVVMNLSYALHGHRVGYELEDRERNEAQRKPSPEKYVSGYSLKVVVIMPRPRTTKQIIKDLVSLQLMELRANQGTLKYLALDAAIAIDTGAPAWLAKKLQARETLLDELCYAAHLEELDYQTEEPKPWTSTFQNSND